MPRRYRRRIVNKDKYSVEQTVGKTSLSSNWTTIEGSDENTQNSVQASYVVVPALDAQGMRKVKHLTCSFTASNDSAKVIYALVYVPAGYTANPIRFPADDRSTNMYEPNQYVMSVGVLDFSGGPLRIRSPLSRNLNSGDSIQIIFATNDTNSVSLVWSTKYAITLQ